jgi:hypothetical protein
MISMDHWVQTIEISQNAINVMRKYDNVTKLFGEKSTPEQILEMAKGKGVTYSKMTHYEVVIMEFVFNMWM